MKRLLRIRLWHLLMLTAIIAGGLAFWRLHVAPYLDQQIGEQHVAELGGRVEKVAASPQWLGRWIGRDRFHRVVEVHLEHCDLDDDDLRALHDLPYVQRLYLAGTPISDAGVRHLADLPHLRRLSLWRTNVSDGCLEWVRRCEKLEAVDIHDTCITDSGLATLRGLSRLTFLKLGGPIDGSGLQHVATLPNLRTLDLSKAWIEEDAWRHLRKTQLRTLVLRQSMPGSIFSTLAELPRLEEMPYTTFDECTDEDVAALAQHPRLQSIALESTRLTDRSMRTLATLPRLRDLTIRGALTDRSLETLVTFPALNSVHASGRFSPSQLRQTLQENPKLTGELRTAIYPGPLTHGREGLPIKWLVTSRSMQPDRRHPQRRFAWPTATKGSAEVEWPATPADIPEEQLSSEVQELILRAPYTAADRRLECDLMPLAAAANLQELHFYYLRPADLKPLGRIPHLRKLRFHVRGLTDDDLDRLELPNSLQLCSFVPSHITLPGLLRLRDRYPHAEITAGGIGRGREDGRFSAIDSGPGTLESYLTYPDVQLIHLPNFSQTLDLSPLATRQQLDRLSLAPNPGVWPVWKNYPPTFRLQELTVGPSTFSDANLSQISQPTALVHLSLTGTRVSDSGLRYVARCTALRSLTIDGTSQYWFVAGGGYLTGRTLSQLAKCQLLESLSLRHTRLHDDYIDEFPPLPNLQSLQLDATDVGDVTVARLVQQVPSLTSLGLAYTRVTDDGVKHLLKLPKLAVLDLRGTEVTGASLLALIDAEQLKMLYIGITDQDEKYLEAFAHHRKDVQVIPR